MGGSESKYSIFDDNPKDYTDIPGEDDTCVWDEKNWRIRVQCYGCKNLHIEASRSYPDRRKYECVYQIIITNKYHLRRIIRGVEKLGTGDDWIYSESISNVCCKPSYNQFNLQFVAYAIIEKNGLRKLNFKDENVFGKSMTILTSGGSLEVPIQTISKGAPLLAKYIDENKPNPKLIGCSEEFFQVFHGVHIQLGVEEIMSLLKFAAKFQVLNVKRYCEQQLIRREDLKVSKKRKFRIACEYNLNILMNQVLRNVKTVKSLAKLASIAIEMESMDTNISKLLIAKMYKIS